MMVVIRFFSEPFWQQLGLTLMHFLWQGLAITALAAVAVRLFRLAPGRPRYAAYLVAFLLMAVCPVLTFIAVDGVAVGPGSPLAANDIASAPIAAATAKESPATGASVARAAPSRAVTDVTGPASAENRIERYLPWAVTLWMLGVILLSLRLVLGFIGMWRWRRHLQPLPERLAGRVGQLVGRFGMADFCNIFISSNVQEAAAVGYLRPMVLLPAAMLTRMDPAMIEAVVAHELAHIRRFDLWVNLAQRIVETLLFYHPAVWWLSNRLRTEREFCCDEMAVAATGERLTYASALKTAHQGRLAAMRPTLAVGLGHDKQSTLRRVRHILGLPPAHADSRSWLAGIVVVVLLAILAIPAASALTARTHTSNTTAEENLTLRLIEAAEAGDVEAVKDLLAQGADVNSKQDEAGRTPLHFAAEKGRGAIAELLVAEGAEVNARTQDKGWTPLVCAVIERHPEVVRILLENGAEVDASDNWGYTALCYAIWNEDIPLIETLIAAGANVDKRFSEENSYTPFFEAIWMDNAALTEILIDAGADVNCEDDEGWTPLHWAIYYGSTETARLFIGTDVKIPPLHRAVLAGDSQNVEQLIENGLDVDTPDRLGWTSAFWAVSAGREAICEYLLDEGADPIAKIDDGCSLLHQASRGGYVDLVERLIALGAEVDALYGSDRHPRSALGEAAINGHEEIVKLLIANGADVNLHAGQRAPVIYAPVYMGQPAMVDLLIAHGADVNISAPNGPAMLHTAVDCKPYVDEETCAEIVGKLIAAGADVNAKDPRTGNTPLHIAAREGKRRAAQHLIRAGADLSAKNEGNKTPLDVAEEEGHRDMARMFRANGK